MSQLALFTTPNQPVLFTPPPTTPDPPKPTPPAPAPPAASFKPLQRGSIFAWEGRRYQIEELTPDWGEHGKLVALDLSNTTVPICRVWTNLSGFTRTTGYALEV